ncbi:MAG: efflux RND transporter periplasmic adaptor subunit [Methylococcaceae bacterium]|nr:efflux RND transporter periplasmic adaptor subunit [Methylococcaceae bacterium]
MMTSIPPKPAWQILTTLWRPAICLLAALAVVGCISQAETETTLQRPVRVVRVTASVPDSPASFAGEVTAHHEAELAFRVPGKLVARPVEVGDRVHQGQLLAQLDSTDYRLAVEGLTAQLAGARAERDFARDDLRRYQELLAQRIIGPPELDRHRTLYEAAKERTAALKAQLDQAIHQLTYTDLVADGDGIITAVKAEASQVLAVGQAVAKLARLDELEVSIQVPEHRINAVRSGQTVDVTLWTDGGRRFQGRIREIAPAAASASRTYAVKVTLLEGRESARLGMTANVHLPPDQPPRIVVPLAAVFSPLDEPAQSRVWRVDERSRTVNSALVRLGEIAGKEQVAVMGISEGDLIVSAGVHRLMEGQSVRFSEDANSAAKVGVLASTGEQP